jgi:hypothetical protein
VSPRFAWQVWQTKAKNLMKRMQLRKCSKNLINVEINTNKGFILGNGDLDILSEQDSLGAVLVIEHEEKHIVKRRIKFPKY